MAEVENLTANSAEELEALRIKYLSKKGAINDLMADFRNVPAEQKKEVGMKINELKHFLNSLLDLLFIYLLDLESECHVIENIEVREQSISLEYGVDVALIGRNAL